MEHTSAIFSQKCSFRRILNVLMALFFMCSGKVAAAGVTEGCVSIRLPRATELVTDQWYVMYNVGRKGFLYDASNKLYIATAPPEGDDYAYLVRLVEVNGKTCVQTGLGRYFTKLSTSNNSGTTVTAGANNAYTYGTIAEGYFWLKDAAGMVLDANALDADLAAKSTVAGWGTTTPTSTTGNNSWTFYPVELTDMPASPEDVPHTHGTFSFQSAHNDLYLHLDANNLALTEDEMTAAIHFNGEGGWTINVPEGTSSKPAFHIGTDGKFSAGPASTLHLYHVWPIADGEYRYTEVSAVQDASMYLIVGEYNGADYAMINVVGNSGTANQRMLSSKVTFIPDEDCPQYDNAVPMKATFTGQYAAEVERHHWAFRQGAEFTQDPFVYTPGETGGASGSGKPLLTIACLSDIHTQEGWHTTTEWEDKDNGIRKPSQIADVAVRESLAEAVNALRQEEQVDVVIVGGDCQSDATIDEEHWRQVRRLMADNLRSVSAANNLPVLYVNGNHEYEVANTWGSGASAAGTGYYIWRHSRPFNAGEYYEFPMASDNGILAAETDCFYEEAPNPVLLDTERTMPLLAAYHYNIKGFDFVVLNCGKPLFHNSNNYTYSEESVRWVERKLKQIYADDPRHEKTVFFALHIPFGDSNSINTNEDKGMSYDPATHHLKQVLAQYPGLIMLYGHDHGYDNAYIRRNTSQRVTRYDTDGHVMQTADGVNTFDKNDVPTASYAGQSVYLHPYDNATGYLGVKSTFNENSASLSRSIALLDERVACTIIPEADGAVSMRIGDGSMHLYYNSGFKLTPAVQQALRLYKVEINGTHFTRTLVQEVEEGGTYLIASPSGIVFRQGGSRVMPEAAEYSYSLYHTYFWTAELPKAAEPSFVSSFMGSLRYYANACGEPANASRNPRKLIQGLLIYVYPDRIVFNMKNFRNNTGTRVMNELTPFVLQRATRKPDAEAVIAHNPDGAFFQRVDDLAELSHRNACIFVDESRSRTFGMANNGTNKFKAITLDAIKGDGIIESSIQTDEALFYVEQAQPDAAVPTWYLRSADGYIKHVNSKILHRQQRQSYFTGNILDNEAMNAQLTPWAISNTGETGTLSVSHPDLGELQKYTTGMTTADLRLYRKVIRPQWEDGASLTTLYAEHALRLPDGVEAYTVSGVAADGQLVCVRQPLTIPAKTPLILRRHDMEDHLIPVIDDRYAAPIASAMQGTLATLPATKPIDDSGEVMSDVRFFALDPLTSTFELAGGDGVSYINPATQAYLVLPAADAMRYESGTHSLVESLDRAEVNAIHPLSSSEIALPQEIYNLAGQRVKNLSAPGVYVVNGKKLIIK